MHPSLQPAALRAASLQEERSQPLSGLDKRGIERKDEPAKEAEPAVIVAAGVLSDVRAYLGIDR